jgi:hypothetical protein
VQFFRVASTYASQQDFAKLRPVEANRWIFGSDMPRFYLSFVAILLMRPIAQLSEA